MLPYKPLIQEIVIAGSDYRIDVLRLDQLHPDISGNKWFKLKYNLEKASEMGHHTILTFGGAFSNHIAATAAACKLSGFKSIGVIRGNETEVLNPTLSKAKQDGMQLYFTDRETYKIKHTDSFSQELLRRFGSYYVIPEGGNNKEGIAGCMEILKPELDHDYVLCACGTAATFSGVLAAATPSQKVVGISVLKGENKLSETVSELLKDVSPGFEYRISGNEEFEKQIIDNSCLANTYCFNGYARFNVQLATFKNNFERQHNIPLDHIYTTKLFYALTDLVEKKKFKPGSRILVIHSGGLQGNKSFELRYPKALGSLLTKSL